MCAHSQARLCVCVCVCMQLCMCGTPFATSDSSRAMVNGPSLGVPNYCTKLHNESTCQSATPPAHKLGSRHTRRTIVITTTAGAKVSG